MGGPVEPTDDSDQHRQTDGGIPTPYRPETAFGDRAMGDHEEAMEWIRRLPGRRVLVLGNHDLTRAGKCRYLNERAEDRRQPRFEAVVPFLFWNAMIGFVVYVHHTHTRVQWHDDKAAWARAAPFVSTTVHLRFPWRWGAWMAMSSSARSATPISTSLACSPA